MASKHGSRRDTEESQRLGSGFQLASPSASLKDHNDVRGIFELLFKRLDRACGGDLSQDELAASAAIAHEMGDAGPVIGACLISADIRTGVNKDEWNRVVDKWAQAEGIVGQMSIGHTASQKSSARRGTHIGNTTLVDAWLNRMRSGDQELACAALREAVDVFCPEVVDAKLMQVFELRRSDKAWDDVQSDGVEESGLPPQDAECRNDIKMLAVGQSLELCVEGAWHACKIHNVESALSYPYTISFADQIFPDRRVMIDVFRSKLLAPLWLDEEAHVNFLEDEEACNENELASSLLSGAPLDATLGQFIGLIRRCRESLQRELAVVKVEMNNEDDDAAVAFIGDLHGNFKALAALIAAMKISPSKQKIVFLGGYVDRGDADLELLAFVIASKLKSPEQIVLLRGNHEEANINCRYGFEKSCKLKYGEIGGAKLYRQVNNMFTYLPIAAIVAGTVFCCHGGIGPEIKSLLDVEALQKEKPMALIARPRKKGKKNQSILRHLLWADPRSSGEANFDAQGFSPNTSRNVSVFWNEVATNNFLRSTGLEAIVRGHECVDVGYRYCHSGKVLTIFSSPGHCNRNHGAGVLFQGDVANMRHWRIDSDYKIYDRACSCRAESCEIS